MFINKMTMGSTSFKSESEVELFYSLKSYLNEAGVLTAANYPLLHRYCKMQYEWVKMLDKKPKNYLIEKYASVLIKLEKELCLTPASMLKFKKDTALVEAKNKKNNI